MKGIRLLHLVHALPGDLPYIGEIQARGGPKKILAEAAPGQWGVKYLEGPNAGKFERRTVVDVETEPMVGYHPVEVWRDGTKYHFGNEITEIESAQPVSSRGQAPVAELPRNKRVILKARTLDGNDLEVTMEAREAERMVTRRKTNLETLLDCLSK